MDRGRRFAAALRKKKRMSLWFRAGQKTLDECAVEEERQKLRALEDRIASGRFGLLREDEENGNGT